MLSAARRLRPFLLAPVLLVAAWGLVDAIARSRLVGLGLALLITSVLAAALRPFLAAQWPQTPSVWSLAGGAALVTMSIHGADAVGGAAMPLLLVCLVTLGVASWPRTGADAPAGSLRQHPGRRSVPTLDVVVRELRRHKTVDLCHTWVLAGAELARTTRPDRGAALVAVREAVLNELERRDPHGVRRWLRSGAAAVSSPSAFLSDRRPPQEA